MTACFATSSVWSVLSVLSVNRANTECTHYKTMMRDHRVVKTSENGIFIVFRG